MKCFSLAILILTALFTFNSVSAQRLETGISVKRPDFSGRWRLNRSKSSEDRSLLPGVFSIVVTIEQKLPSIRFRFTADALLGGTGTDAVAGLAEEFTLFVDGRGDIYGEGIVRGASTTSWQDNKLLTTRRNKANTIIGYQQVELTSNGRTLKISGFGPEGPESGRPGEAVLLDKLD